MRPNILLLTAHDVGRHVGCYGADTVRTPNLDAIAREGVRFANSFCSAPQCSPSRAALFTGRYPHSTGVLGLTHAYFGWDLAAGERHLAGILRDAGWSTAVCGVCHETQDALRVGYEEHFGDGVVESGSLADQAIAFIGRQGPAEKPFFLHVGLFEPHRLPGGLGFGSAEPDDEQGAAIPPYLLDEPSAREELAAFQGAVRAMDAAVGRVLEALDAHGIREDTLVVATTDHGIPFPRAKLSLYDAGLHALLLMRWPGAGWATGQVHEEPVNNIDVLPTLLDLVGLPVPDAVQGRSFADLLQGRSHERRSEVFAEMTYHDYCDPRRCIRTDAYKLIVNFSNAPTFMDPTQSWRPRTAPRRPNPMGFGPDSYHKPVELYDLASDPVEFDNLAASAEHAPVRADLLTRLHRWMEQTGDPLLTGIPRPPMHQLAIASLTAESNRRDRG